MGDGATGKPVAMDDERDDESISLRPGIRGGEGLADTANSPEAAPGTPSDLGRDSLRGDGLAQDAPRAEAEGETERHPGELGRDGIRGDGLAEDA
jgi:hypothetical protein